MSWKNAVALLPLFVVLSCGGSPSEPGGGSTPEPLAQVEIGAGGGVLQVEGFTLTVPAGAFDRNVTLELYPSDETFPAGDAATSRYRLEGLPSRFSQPLELRIGVKSRSEGEPLIMMGENVFVKSLQETDLSWRPLEAQDQDSVLVTTLEPPPDEGPAGSAAEAHEPGVERTDFEFLSVPLGGTFYYSTLNTSAGHFKIYYPSSMKTHAEKLGTFLEEAYDKFLALGFDYSARTRWPVRVIVLSMPSNRFGQSVPSIWGYNYASMRFNTDKLSDYPAMRVTAGHEFFHLVQDYYDPRGAYERATLPSGHYWVDEATAVWSEELFSDDADYVSPIRSGLIMEPFEGLQAGVEGGDANHGYGMSALIKELVDNEGDEIVKHIYEHLLDGEEPAKAIELALGGPYADWYNEFFTDYFSGYIYGDTETQFMVAGNLGEWTVKTEGDTLKSWHKGTPALGGRIFKVVLNYPQLNDDSRAKFTIEGDGPRMLNVFKYKSSERATLLGSDADSVTVERIKDLMDQGYMLIVLTTNLDDDAPDYYHDAENTVTAQILPGTPILDALKRTTRLFYEIPLGGGTHTFRWTDPDTTYTFEAHTFPGMGDMIPSGLFDGPWPPLSLTGTSFQTSMSYEVWTWNISGTFSPDGRTLTSLYAYAEENDQTQGTLEVWLTNLPVTSVEIHEDWCSLGWAARGESHITIQYHRSWPAGANVEDGIVTEDYVGSVWDVPIFGFSFSQSPP